MPRYLLLPYETPTTFASQNPSEMKAIIRRYGAWTKGLARTGALVVGEKLKDGEGRRLKRKGSGVQVAEGPTGESGKELIGGLWIIKAKSYDEAVQLAENCPHLDYGVLVIRAMEG